MRGYRGDDDSSTNGGTGEGSGVSRLFGLVAAFAIGLPVAIIAGQFTSDGVAEIAGIMAASFALCVRAFWDYRAKRWFAPLVTLWAVMNFVALSIITSMNLQTNRDFVLLVWLEFFAFAGLLWAATRLWGDLPD